MMKYHAAIFLGLMSVSVMAQEPPLDPPLAGDSELLPLPDGYSILPELSQEPSGLLTGAVEAVRPEEWVPQTDLQKEE